MEGPRQAFAAALAAETRHAPTLLPVVLELYAGTCHFSQAAARFGFAVIAFDLSFGFAYRISLSGGCRLEGLPFCWTAYIVNLGRAPACNLEARGCLGTLST